MASTYEKIATTTLGSASATVTFSSISGSYTDLVLVIVGASSTSTSAVHLRFNSDTGSNYSNTRLVSGSSDRQSNQTKMRLALNNNVQGNILINIQNYSNSTTYKTALARSNDNEYVNASVGLWRSTSAINAIEVSLDAPTFIAGSMFTLYGILKA